LVQRESTTQRITPGITRCALNLITAKFSMKAGLFALRLNELKVDEVHFFCSQP
jgi:hypothetical protein